MFYQLLSIKGLSLTDGNFEVAVRVKAVAPCARRGGGGGYRHGIPTLASAIVLILKGNVFYPLRQKHSCVEEKHCSLPLKSGVNTCSCDGASHLLWGGVLH